MRRQSGVTIFGMMVVCVILIFGALGGLKIGPAYIEYLNVKKAVVGIVTGGEARGTVADIRKAFEKRAQVDDITVVTGQDLEITKEGNDVVVSFAYSKKIALVGNISLLIDFSGASNR